VVWVARTAEAHLSGGGAFVERAAAQAVPLMGLPLVPMTVSWPADTKLFVRGTTRDREASFRPLGRSFRNSPRLRGACSSQRPVAGVEHGDQVAHCRETFTLRTTGERPRAST
jgi:hypothetical protein